MGKLMPKVGTMFAGPPISDMYLKTPNLKINILRDNASTYGVSVSAIETVLRPDLVSEVNGAMNRFRNRSMGAAPQRLLPRAIAARAAEFKMRLEGASYEAIARAGGGILSSVAATRGASEAELLRRGTQPPGCKWRFQSHRTDPRPLPRTAPARTMSAS